MNAAGWRLTLAAALPTAPVFGTRAAFGLFVSPLNTASGLGLATLSLTLALAAAALAWPRHGVAPGHAPGPAPMRRAPALPLSPPRRSRA